MAEKRKFEFFLLRYVPDAVKDEFVNVGVVMMEPGANGSGSAGLRFTRDWRRVRCIDPGADIELLQAWEREIHAQLRDGGDREALMHRLRDSFSNVIQLSPVKGCLAEDPRAEMEMLTKLYLERPAAAGKRQPSGRQRIVAGMRTAFEQAGIWDLMMREIAVEKYTYKGDPLKIDCAYRPNGVIRMFQAMPIASDVNAAKVLAFSYPQIAEGIAKVEKATASLSAIVEDGLDRSDEAILFALATMEKSLIGVATVSEMPRVAEMARLELRL